MKTFFGLFDDIADALWATACVFFYLLFHISINVWSATTIHIRVCVGVAIIGIGSQDFLTKGLGVPLYIAAAQFAAEVMFRDMHGLLEVHRAMTLRSRVRTA